ncbi:MAG: TRAP transporter small permease [Pseudomonadota bacterium]
MAFVTTVSKMAGLLGAILLALTGAMLTYEVVARYFFLKPTIWAAELSQLCLIWGCLLAMAHVLAIRRHITVNAVTNLLPQQAQRVFAAGALITVIVFCAIIAVYGWEIFYTSWERGRTTGSILNLPMWIVELSVPTGFALLGAQAVVELLRLREDGTTRLGSSHE